MRHLVRLAVLALALAAPSAVLAQAPAPHARHGMHHGRRGGPPGARAEHRVERLIGSLGLDDAQATQVRQFVAEARTQHEALRGQSLTEEERRTQHRAIMEATGQRIRAILRPDQQRIFDYHVARMRERAAERRGEAPRAPEGI